MCNSELCMTCPYLCLQVSLAAMKCFRTIVDPQPNSSSSPRNSLSPGNMATPTSSPTKGGIGQEYRMKKSPSPAPPSMLSLPEGSDQVKGYENMDSCQGFSIRPAGDNFIVFGNASN